MNLRFTPQGKSGVSEGAFTIRQADFMIGEGPWARFDIVANDVQLKFRTTATAVRQSPQTNDSTSGAI